MKRYTFRSHFKKFIKKAGVKEISFHDVSYTHATLLLKQRVHPKIISERLGHTNISMTLRIYSHILPNMQKEAVENFGKSIFG